MNSTLEKIVVWTLVTAQLLFSGCAETHISKKKAEEEIVFQQKVVSPSDIKIADNPSSGDTPDIDTLIATSENYIQYLSFRQAYSSYGDQIISNLQNNNFSATENLVKELAAKLEKDQNPYAQDYLKRVKGFSYTLYEVYEIEESKPKRKAKDASIIGAGPFIPVIVGITLLNDVFSGGKTHLTEELFTTRIGTQTELIGKTVRKIRITPYTGAREVIESNIPYEKVKEELKK